MAGGDFPVPDWPGKVAGNAGHDRIAACLVMDIQRAADWAHIVLSHVRDVQEGGEDHWEMAMNAYMLSVGPQTTDIAPVYEEAGEVTVSVQTSELCVALQAWCQQITQQSD